MKTITFYSYKGGVGRSLALANIANRLAEFGKKVCMLDFDLEAPGLHIKFSDSIGKNGIKRGLVDYIHKFTSENVVPENISDYVTGVNSFNEGGTISLIAAGNTSREEYWKKLSHIDWTKLFYEKDSLGVDFFYNLKLQIEKQLAPDVLLIDSRTGITDIAGVTMSIMADEVVLFAANNMENLDGIGQVLCSLAVPSNSLRNEMPKINVVLSRIPYFTKAKDKPREANAKNAAIRILNEKLDRKKIRDYSIEKIFVVHSEPELEMQEEIRIHHKTGDALSQSITNSDYLELFEELTLGIVDDKEGIVLDNIKKASSLMESAMKTESLEERVKLLKEAVNLAPRFVNAYLNLGLAYFSTEQYKEALDILLKAEELSPQFEDFIEYFKAHALYKLGEIDQAQNLYEKQINKELNLGSSYAMLGVIHQRKKKYNKSMSYYKKAIKEEPENADIWNAYANGLRILGLYEESFEAVYRALDLDPQHLMATTTLAELNAGIKNYREFYKNIDLAFSLGLTPKLFQQIIDEDEFYKQFVDDEKLNKILDKYKIDVEWDRR
ncbi:MAG: KGGVGR-motif variant AAA ATPase [Sphingobacterium sp.]